MKKYNTNHTFAICAYGESEYLEECISSLLNQTVKTNILISTSTPSEYIYKMAEKYGLPLCINKGEHGITQDWNFAYEHADTDYVTIAHQDDIYDKRYVECLLNNVNKVSRPLIYFTDYAEVRDGAIVANNKLLNTKRILLAPLRVKILWSNKWIRRRILSLGSAICCPSVTYFRPNLPSPLFLNGFRSCEDWETWERVSRLKGAFVYNKKILTYHRIHENSETSKIIHDNKRTEEDFIMYRMFWPEWIAKILIKKYASSQKSNDL